MALEDVRHPARAEPVAELVAVREQRLRHQPSLRRGGVTPPPSPVVGTPSAGRSVVGGSVVVGSVVGRGRRWSSPRWSSSRWWSPRSVVVVLGRRRLLAGWSQIARPASPRSERRAAERRLTSSLTSDRSWLDLVLDLLRLVRRRSAQLPASTLSWTLLRLSTICSALSPGSSPSSSPPQETRPKAAAAPSARASIGDRAAWSRARAY